MTLLARFLTAFLTLPLAACFSLDLPRDAVERSVTRSFTVAPHSAVRVAVSGGSVSATTGDPGTVQVTLVERVRTNSDDQAQIDRDLADYQVTLGQQDDEVVVTAHRRADATWRMFKMNQIGFSVRLVVPADVRLRLGTSGGAITVRGDRAESINANTSGGSIKVEGGGGDMDLGTSGGSITVDRALASLKAHTSGGSIAVGYVGPRTKSVDVGTSGGGIRIGVDPSAALDLEASTSGGGVHVGGLPFDGADNGHSHARGTINGGGNRLHASTSGGSITINAATP